MVNFIPGLHPLKKDSMSDSHPNPGILLSFTSLLLETCPPSSNYSFLNIAKGFPVSQGQIQYPGNRPYHSI